MFFTRAFSISAKQSLCRLSVVGTIADIGRKAFAKLSQGANYFFVNFSWIIVVKPQEWVLTWSISWVAVA